MILELLVIVMSIRVDYPAGNPYRITALFVWLAQAKVMSLTYYLTYLGTGNLRYLTFVWVHDYRRAHKVLALVFVQ